MSEESDNIKLSPEYLFNLKRNLLATAFKETIDELLLYQRGRCLKMAKNAKSRKISQKSYITDDKETSVSAEILEDIKFDKELDVLRNIYKVAYDEVTSSSKEAENPCELLQKAIDAQNVGSNEIDILIKELEDNKCTLERLKSLQTENEIEQQTKLSQKSQKLKDLRDQLNNVKRLNSLELRLVEKWENNRLTQATIMGENKERSLMKEILQLNRSMAAEQRLIYDIESFRNNESCQLKAKIAYWEKKFKEDSAKVAAETSTLKKDIAEVIKATERHREIAEQQRIFVAEYLKEKAEEQRLYAIQCHRVECAVRIQAWWRGVMVRKCLGPYQMKSKRGKKTKGKK